MLRKIALNIIKVIEKISKKKILFLNEKTFLPNNTAALSEYGFWYAGNVYDMGDISYGIAAQGSVEKDDTSLVTKVLAYISKNKKIALYDIGANSGYYGILSAYLYKKNVQVYSFEPLQESVDCIEKSVYLNKLNNVKIFPFGLGNTDEEKTMYLAATGSTFEKGFSSDGALPERKLRIKRLDDIVVTEKITHPDFMKIDVEGHELKVFEGAKETIQKNLPVLFVEIIYSMKNLGRSYINADYEATFDFPGKIGYEAYSLIDNRLEKFDPKEKLDGVHMYLFLHTDKHSELKNYILNEKIG